MKLWCFTFFTALTSHPPPQNNPKNFGKKTQCLKTKNPRPNNRSPPGDDPSSLPPNGTGGRWSSGSAVLLCGASVLWFQFSYGNHHCASHRNMYHMGWGSSGGFFFVWKKTLFVSCCGIGFFFGCFWYLFFIYHIIMYVCIIYHIIIYQIIYHISKVNYHISSIMHHISLDMIVVFREFPEPYKLYL